MTTHLGYDMPAQPAAWRTLVAKHAIAAVTTFVLGTPAGVIRWNWYQEPRVDGSWLKLVGVYALAYAGVAIVHWSMRQLRSQ